MIITLIIRFFQLLFAAVVLGLSVTLIKTQLSESTLPAAFGYTAFTGGFGMLAAIIGIVALFVEPLGGLVSAAIDGLSSLFNLAGGIAIVILIRGISCSSNSDRNLSKLYGNKLTNGGCIKFKGKPICKEQTAGDLHKRCRENSADAAFMFMSFVVCLGAAILALLAMRRGTARKGVIV